MTRFLIVFFLGLMCPGLSCAASPPPIKKFQAPKDGKLTTEMEKFYEENGFLVLENFASENQANNLKAHGKILARKHHISNKKKLQIFDAGKNVNDKNSYFFDSADKIMPFYEAGAIDNGVVLYFPEDSMNKLAHALHSKDETFKTFSTSDKFKNLSQSLNIKSPIIIQSMILFKPARIGSAVAPHQDAAFLSTKPQSVTGFWLALDEATTTNGCLWAIPGGHKTDELYARFVISNEEGLKSAEFVDEVDMGWKEDDFVPLEVDPGSLIILHGMLPHRSYENRSESSRNAYSFHVVSGEADYSDRNWLQNPRKVALSKAKGRGASTVAGT